MNSSKRYLTYLALAFIPQLYGCLWENIHVDGTLDASSKQEEVSPEQSGDPKPLEEEDNK